MCRIDDTSVGLFEGEVVRIAGVGVTEQHSVVD